MNKVIVTKKTAIDYDNIQSIEAHRFGGRKKLVTINGEIQLQGDEAEEFLKKASDYNDRFLDLLHYLRGHNVN